MPLPNIGQLLIGDLFFTTYYNDKWTSQQSEPSLFILDEPQKGVMSSLGSSHRNPPVEGTSGLSPLALMTLSSGPLIMSSDHSQLNLLNPTWDISSQKYMLFTLETALRLREKFSNQGLKLTKISKFCIILTRLCSPWTMIHQWILFNNRLCWMVLDIHHESISLSLEPSLRFKVILQSQMLPFSPNARVSSSIHELQGVSQHLQGILAT